MSKDKGFFELRRKRRAAVKNLKEKTPQLDPGGNSIVNVSVAEDDDFLSPYGDSENLVISEEMAGYLKNATNGIPVKDDLHFKIKCSDVNKHNESKFRMAIHNYYSNQFIEIERKLKFNAFGVLATFILALVFLGVWALLDHFHVVEVVTLIVEIVAWVFMWEAVDLFFFQRSYLRHKKNRILQLLNAKVSFVID